MARPFRARLRVRIALLLLLLAGALALLLRPLPEEVTIEAFWSLVEAQAGPGDLAQALAG